VFLSHALADDDIALEEVDDGLWNILFYSSLIGRFDQRTCIITGADFRHSKGRGIKPKSVTHVPGRLLPIIPVAHA
jgi:hypothetical protein